MIARHGNLQVLRRAQEHGCPWGESTCAAPLRAVTVLRWAREQGCPWDESIDDFDFDFDCCALAARGGHLEVLMWLREHGCL